MKTLYKALFATVLCAFCLQACSFEEEKIFDDTPTARMNKFLDNTQKILMSSESGWIMHYYPDKSQSYGGYNFIIRFSADSIFVKSELVSDHSLEVPSLYRLGYDSGPMLNFDTYNTLMHFFATPSSSRYQGYGGDFEFMILEAQADHVKLMGRRSGNIIMMYPLNQDPKEYLDKVGELYDNFIINGFSGTVNGTEISASVDKNMQQLSISAGEEVYESAFIFTDKGIRLYSPVELSGTSISELYFNAETFEVTIPEPSVVLKGSIPAGYRRYEDYLGNYQLVYDKSDDSDESYNTVPVSLVQHEAGSTYLMTGLNDNFQMVWNYDKSLGNINIQHQNVLTRADGSTVRLCAIDCTSGYFTWTAGVPYLSSSWDENEENVEYRLSAGYYWTSNTRKSDGFYLCIWDAADNRKSAPSAAAEKFFGTSTSIKYIYSLVKE